MLHLAIVFLVVALIAAFCGFSGVAALSFGLLDRISWVGFWRKRC